VTRTVNWDLKPRLRCRVRLGVRLGSRSGLAVGLGPTPPRHTGRASSHETSAKPRQRQQTPMLPAEGNKQQVPCATADRRRALLRSQSDGVHHYCRFTRVTARWRLTASDLVRS
jgi:hypothetical protein